MVLPAEFVKLVPAPAVNVATYCPVVFSPNATASFAICAVNVTFPKSVIVAVPDKSPPNVIVKSSVLKLSFPVLSSYVTAMPVSAFTGDTMLPTISWTDSI